MGTHFKPLSRKFGIVTLVMACVLMLMWIRGLMIQDEIQLGNGHGRRFHTLSTSHGGLVWKRDDSEFEMTWLTGWQSHPTARINSFDL
jgi:hypothetical protein